MTLKREEVVYIVLDGPMYTKNTNIPSLLQLSTKIIQKKEIATLKCINTLLKPQKNTTP